MRRVERIDDIGAILQNLIEEYEQDEIEGMVNIVFTKDGEMAYHASEMPIEQVVFALEKLKLFLL